MDYYLSIKMNKVLMQQHGCLKISILKELRQTKEYSLYIPFI